MLVRPSLSGIEFIRCEAGKEKETAGRGHHSRLQAWFAKLVYRYLHTQQTYLGEVERAQHSFGQHGRALVHTVDARREARPGRVETTIGQSIGQGHARGERDEEDKDEDVRRRHVVVVHRPSNTNKVS